MGPLGFMFMLKVVGLLIFVSSVLLLAVSFFVLIAARKAEGQLLKAFGYIITILLWLCAGVLLGSLLSAATAKKCGRAPMMMQGGMMKGRNHQMMKGKMPMMQQGKMPMQGQPAEPAPEAPAPAEPGK